MTKSKETTTDNKRKIITSDDALKLLKEGNERFSTGKSTFHNYYFDVIANSKEQFPMASILACLDSRVSPEIVFDQSIGDLFVARVAGNFVTEEILASLKFSITVFSRLIVVMGHTSCGAVGNALKGFNEESRKVVGSGLIHSNILKNLEEAIKADEKVYPDDDSRINGISRENVNLTVKEIQERLEKIFDTDIKFKVVGAMYNIKNGKVEFID